MFLVQGNCQVNHFFSKKVAKAIVISTVQTNISFKAIVKSIVLPKFFSRQLSTQLFGEHLFNFFVCQLLWFLGWFWSIMVNFGTFWSIIGNFTGFEFILVTSSVFLLNFWSIICHFLSNFWQFVPQFFYKIFCQFKYLLNYCWKSIIQSIIFSIIAWCGLVEPGF